MAWLKWLTVRWWTDQWQLAVRVIRQTDRQTYLFSTHAKKETQSHSNISDQRSVGVCDRYKSNLCLLLSVWTWYQIRMMCFSIFLLLLSLILTSQQMVSCLRSWRNKAFIFYLGIQHGPWAHRLATNNADECFLPSLAFYRATSFQDQRSNWVFYLSRTCTRRVNRFDHRDHSLVVPYPLPPKRWALQSKLSSDRR